MAVKSAAAEQRREIMKQQLAKRYQAQRQEQRLNPTPPSAGGAKDSGGRKKSVAMWGALASSVKQGGQVKDRWATTARKLRTSKLRTSVRTSAPSAGGAKGPNAGGDKAKARRRRWVACPL